MFPISITRAIITTIALSALSISSVHADYFVFKLAPPANDDMPTIEVGATVGGVRKDIKLVIDTGDGIPSNGGLYISPTAATSLGMNTAGGTADSAQGVGGSTVTTKDVNLPGGFSFGSPPKVPTGQAATTPTLPVKATVGPTIPNVDALIGSEFLKEYQYGKFTGDKGSFFFLAAKSQGADAAKNALTTAINEATTTPPATDPNGRPGGTKSTPVIPTPTKSLPPGSVPADAGYLANVDLGFGSFVVNDMPFLIKSGLPNTLISEPTALALGIDIGTLVSKSIFTDFGMTNVPVADLTVGLFNEPDFVFSLSVGILSASLNPFAENFLGGDYLGKLSYWEVSTADDNLSGQFYAKVPEPNTLLLVCIAYIGMVVINMISKCRRPFLM